MVMIIIAISVVVVGLVLLFTLALAASARSGDSRLWEDGPLSALGSIRSPSGRPFFASRNAMRDFLQTMEDLGRDLRSSGRSDATARPLEDEPAEEEGAAARQPVADGASDEAARPR